LGSYQLLIRERELDYARKSLHNHASIFNGSGWRDENIITIKGNFIDAALPGHQVGGRIPGII